MPPSSFSSGIVSISTLPSVLSHPVNPYPAAGVGLAGQYSSLVFKFLLVSDTVPPFASIVSVYEFIDHTAYNVIESGPEYVFPGAYLLSADVALESVDQPKNVYPSLVGSVDDIVILSPILPF